VRKYYSAVLITTTSSIHSKKINKSSVLGRAWGGGVEYQEGKNIVFLFYLFVLYNFKNNSKP